MAIHPDHWSPDYEKNLQALAEQGYRPMQYEEYPECLRGICGGDSYVINAEGKIRSVNCVSGKISDFVPPATDIRPSEEKIKDFAAPKKGAKPGPKI